ncbi:hypothetical protein HDV00_010305 [Rhizophlyctis rosea]|nr:hypothetical protein HDV00_010305 [Rhizophlyctis rosea]
MLTQTFHRHRQHAAPLSNILTTRSPISSPPSPSSSESSDTEAKPNAAPSSSSEVVLGRTQSHTSDPSIRYNWSGIQPLARKSQIHYPDSIGSLQHLIRASKNVRVIGSGLSYEPLIALPKDDSSTMISLSTPAFQGLTCSTETTATFGAGTTVDEVIRILGDIGRMMPCNPGVIGIQTLAGAVGTGTHGQGMRQASYADAVVSLTIVLPSGEVARIDRQDCEYPLDAFTVSLGSFGVTVEIELETVPRRVFEVEKLTLEVGNLVDEYQRWNEENEFVKVWWFPETDKTHAWFVNEAGREERERFLSGSRKEAMVSREGSNGLQETIRLYTSTMAEQTKTQLEEGTPAAGGVRLPPSPPPTPEPEMERRKREEYFRPQKDDAPHIRTVTRFLATESLVGYVEQLLTKGIPVPQINCEIAVPMSHFRCAVRRLREWHESTSYKMHYPFIFRGCGGSKAWLSAGYGDEQVVWIGFLVYVAQDGTVKDDAFQMMKEVQEVLRGCGGRPHWGKHIAGNGFWDEEGVEEDRCMSNEESRARKVERTDRFRRWMDLRNQVDPDGKFLGDWVKGFINVD